MSVRKLYKNEKDKVLAGVCSGLAEYFALDPVLIRVLFVIVTIFTGFFPGVIAYLLAVALMPHRPKQ